MYLKQVSLLAILAAASLSAAAAVPEVSEQAKKSAEVINSDPIMQKILQEATSPEGQKWRFNTQMEIVRIASPSRSELRRQKKSCAAL